MKCPQCDAEVNEKSIYCSKCGERLLGPNADLFPEPDRTSEAPASGPPPAGSTGPSDAAKAEAGRRAADAAGPGAVGASDRQTVWEGRYSLKGMIDRLALSALVTIVVVVLGVWWSFSGTWWLVALALVLALWFYLMAVFVARRFGHRYRLTPQTFFHERGILVKSTSPIEIVAIDDISLNQSILERLVGVGRIRILSGDSTDPLLVLKGIPDVQKAFEAIDQARRAERRRRAVRIDAV